MIGMAMMIGAAMWQSAPAQPAPVEAAATRDWAATTRNDLQAFHALIQADHAGPVNPLDPQFNAREGAALALAQRRAVQVRDYAGYFWTMRGYVASFDDGHVQFSTLKGAPMLTAQWPGFLTGLDARGRQVVMTRTDDAPVPLGAELVACDGVAADPLLARNVGAFVGRWSLLATRRSRAGRLFVDSANPFIARPARCTFSVAGQARTVSLAWRPLVDPEWSARLDQTSYRQPSWIGTRTLADGTRWFGMTSFDGDPDGPAGKALRPMIAGMRDQRAAVLAAPAIVLDVRGNGGGSSQWSYDIARILWGDAAVATADDKGTYVEWRASRDNLATIEHYRDQWSKSPDASAESLAWARRIAAGLSAAIAAGKPLWREPSDADPVAVPPSAAPVAARTPPVYVLTDAACASACLDAVDLWTKLGAIQVGQETSADTLYMDIGDYPLPGGIAEVGIPMKVYRGRARGSNVPQVPRYRYDGDMRDTAALERWIATLNGRRNG